MVAHYCNCLSVDVVCFGTGQVESSALGRTLFSEGKAREKLYFRKARLTKTNVLVPSGTQETLLLYGQATKKDYLCTARPTKNTAFAKPGTFQARGKQYFRKARRRTVRHTRNMICGRPGNHFFCNAGPVKNNVFPRSGIRKILTNITLVKPDLQKPLF